MLARSDPLSKADGFGRSVVLSGSPSSRFGADPLSAGVSCGHSGMYTCPKVFHCSLPLVTEFNHCPLQLFTKSEGLFSKTMRAVKFSVSGAFVQRSCSLSFKDPCRNAACEFCQMAC